jgi:hypothetical protein
MNQLAPVVVSHAPALVAASGARASYRFLEFFTAQIRNPHTRRAYVRAVGEFFDWLEAKRVTQLAAIESVHVATYIAQLNQARSAPTAKLRTRLHGGTVFLSDDVQELGAVVVAHALVTMAETTEFDRRKSWP